jgi:8-oxo-dGTP diphosphatase
MDEELEAGARRELLEETGLKVGRLLELGVFGALGRDPRGRVISVVYVGVLSGELPVARSGDDAAEATWLSAQRPPPTAFDHREVLRRARERLRSLAERPAEFRGQLLPRAGVDQLLPLLQAISRQPLNHRRLERVLGKN